MKTKTRKKKRKTRKIQNNFLKIIYFRDIVRSLHKLGAFFETSVSRLRYIGNTSEVESLPQKEVQTTDVQGQVEKLLLPIKTTKD